MNNFCSVCGMDEALTRNLRILIILAVIAITGFDIIQSNPSIWWIYGILVVIVLVVLFIQDRKARNRQKKEAVV
jgi:Flp pilus assembly protein TadB